MQIRKYYTFTAVLFALTASFLLLAIDTFVSAGHVSLRELYVVCTQSPQYWVFNVIFFAVALLVFVYQQYITSLKAEKTLPRYFMPAMALVLGVAVYTVGTLAIIQYEHQEISLRFFIQYNLNHPLVYGLLAFIPYSVISGLIFNELINTRLENVQIHQELENRNRKLEQEIAQRKMNEKELRDAKKEALAGVKAKDQFLSNMSHEIRTPMNGIVGLLNLIEDSNLSEEQQKYLSAIKSSSKTLMVLINQILDLSKINSEKLNLEYVDFNVWETIQSAENTFFGICQEKSIEVRTVIHPSVPKVACGDPVRLNQILVNLLGNAIKFTSDGGVDLIVKGKETDDGPRLEIEVNDTGIGIPGDKLDKIFESFEQASVETTRQYGGSGLGLAISKELVELYGGKIHVESEVGKGTSFSFEIQLQKASGQPLKSENNQKDHLDFNPADITVLVAEDNKVNQMVVTTVLKKSGFKVDVAENGQEVINMVYQKPYDVILMDVRMPIMGGLDATRFIRNATEPPLCDIPIIALSASTMQHEIEMYEKVGMNDHLPKPFTQKQLMDCLEEHLNLSRHSTHS